ncbi:MAG TPA: outer membrane lipoprotein-sorting protein [Burkholderiaceae bacterium]|nr:outer membrane lipoprotein-sorting protein [Burkholderiaceae bacterium]
MVAASDAIRNPQQSFSVTTTLIEYRSGKQVDSNVLAVWSKPDSNSGQYRTLVRFTAPARDAGKLMLKSGDDLWFYDPTNQASIRISPEQRLLGQAANGDVVTVNFAREYQAELDGEEEVTDGERKQRHSHKLTLQARSARATYAKVELWLDARDNRPIKAKFHADSGRLLKTAYYRRYQSEMGAERPTETVIIDGLDTNWITVMRFSDYSPRNIPEVWLQRDYLSRFKPE